MVPPGAALGKGAQDPRTRAPVNPVSAPTGPCNLPCTPRPAPVGGWSALAPTPARAPPPLTFALVVVLAGLLLALHFHWQMPIHTGDLCHRLRLQQDDVIVALAPGHCAVLQRPGLVHLADNRHRARWESSRDPASVPHGPGQDCPGVWPGPRGSPSPKLHASLPPELPTEGSPRGWGLAPTGNSST